MDHPRIALYLIESRRDSETLIQGEFSQICESPCRPRLILVYRLDEVRL